MPKEIIPDGNYLADGGSSYNAEVYDKYLRNMRSGCRGLSQGVVTPFIGYATDRPNGITLRVFYTEETNHALINRFIRPIEDLALENGIDIYSASLWTPHTTISELMYRPGITPTSQEAAFEKALIDSRIDEVIQILQGLPVIFDVLWGGNAITIAASCIPTQVLAARRQMTEEAESLGMGEKDFTNIFHITLARMGPNKQNPKCVRDFNAFRRELMGMYYLILNHPFHAKIDKAEFMSNQQMDQVHEALLIAAVLNSR